MSRSGYAWSRLIPLLVASSSLFAQGVNAQVSGKVISTGGQAIGEARVLIRNSENGALRVVTTDASGRFVAVALPVGPYSLTVEKAGFQTASNIRTVLNLGDAAPLRIRMAPETGAVVEVTAQTAKVDSERASTATLVSPDALTNLPTFNRSFTSLATLTPQVVVEGSRNNLAIAGQRGVNTSINIDGGDNNEPFFGGAVGAAEGKTPFTVSIEAIREYQVITDGASAEFGRMGGGYVNAITKSGTNDLSGSLFYYQRPQALVARQPNLNGKPDSNKVNDFKQMQYGFSAGGPIIKDKLFYFVAYDGQKQTSPVNMTWGGNTPVTLNPSNPADAVLLGKAGAYDSKADSSAVFAKLDWTLSANHQISLRLNHTKFDGDTGSGLMNAQENLSTDQITTDAYVLQWNWTINDTLLNEARVNYVTNDMPRAPYSTLPQVFISNVGTYGAYPFDRTYNTKRVQYQENLTYATPSLQIKAGLDYNMVDVSEFFAGRWRGAYSFSSIDDFRSGKWTTYTQNFGLIAPIQQAGLFATTEKQFSAYIQTDWRLSETFKAGLGLRYDQQQQPDFPILDFSNPLASSMPLTARIPSDRQISPRLSFTWTPEFDNRRTVIRGNIGRYVSTTPAVFLYQVYSANAIRTGSKDFKPADATTYGIPYGAAFNPSAPYWIASLPAGVKPSLNVYTFSQDFKNPRTDRLNLGAERPVGDTVLGLSATVAKGSQLQRTQDINLSTPTQNAYGRLVYGARPNTNYGYLAQYVSDATSIYHAYTFSAKYHKDGSNLDAQLFYTYSVNKDSDSNERNYAGWSTQDASLLGREWSYADTDRRHVLTGYLSYKDTRFSGILASLAVRYLSGFPYGLTYGKDMNGDGNTSNDRLFLGGMDTGRNTLRSCSNLTMDLGLRREFALFWKAKLTLSADVFNLMNRHDTYVRQLLDGKSTDAVPLVITQSAVVGSARQVQLGARLSF